MKFQIGAHDGSVYGIVARSGGFAWRVRVGDSVKSSPALVVKYDRLAYSSYFGSATLNRTKLVCRVWVGSHNHQVTVINPSDSTSPIVATLTLPGSVFASPVPDRSEQWSPPLHLILMTLPKGRCRYNVSNIVIVFVFVTATWMDSQNDRACLCSASLDLW